MGVECFIIFMAAHGVVVWAVGGTSGGEWEHGGGDGHGAGPLGAGASFRGRWLLTQRGICACDGNFDAG